MKKVFLYILFPALIGLTAGCAMSENDDYNNDVTGEGGSLARFTIKGDYLYTVDETMLHAVNIADVEHPKEMTETYVGFTTETIFPYEDYLLLGTQTGLVVYGVSNPASPNQLSSFYHVRSCDPVVAQNGYAYVTLNTANQRCSNGANELQIIDIRNIFSPQLVKSLFISSPLGLDINNDTLYVCDYGLRVINVANKTQPVEIDYFSDIQAQDVIYNNGRLIVVGTDGLHQYEQSGGGLQKISTIPIQL